MQELFQQYSSKYENLKDLMQDEIHRSLRLFNIRFRLALDIEIDFRGEISLTKSKPVRETYVLIIRLMETWNAYEALFQYAKKIGKYVNPKTGKSKVYSQQFLESVGSLEVLKNSLDGLKSIYKKDTKFKKDFDQYIARIENDPDIKKTLTIPALQTVTWISDNPFLVLDAGTVTGQAGTADFIQTAMTYFERKV